MRTEYLNLLNNAPTLPDLSLKRLSKGKTAKGGRNNLGRITIRRRGGGHKRRMYLIDYKGNVGQLTE